jgi:DnaB-like helicase C terminal domain
MTDTYNFTEDFEDLVLACAVRHPDQLMSYGPILDSRYFNGVETTVVARELFAYQQAHGHPPTWGTLMELSAVARRRLNGDEVEIERVVNYVKRLRRLETGDVNYVIDRVVGFARERALVGAIKRVVQSLSEGKREELDIVTVFETALAVGKNIDDMGFLFHADYDKVITRVTDSGLAGVPTGYAPFDRLWRRGWGPGWLVVPLAPPKRYKSTFAACIAKNIIGPSIQRDVLYYTLEISGELTLARVMCNMTGLTMDDLYDDTAGFRNLAQSRVNDLVAGNLLVKDFAAGEAAISDVAAHAQQAVHQFKLKPALIVIDYAETVRGESALGNRDSKEYTLAANVYTQARALGKRMGCAVLMPDRCTKEAVNKPVPQMTDFQGAFRKAGIVDVALALCATESEIRKNVLRYFTVLNRHGRQGVMWRGKIDAGHYDLSVDEEIDYDPDDGPGGDDDDDDGPRGKPKRRGRGGKRGGGDGLPPEFET